MKSCRTLPVAILTLVAGACAGTAVTREALIPIPEHPPRANVPPHVRGSEREAARVPSEQEFVILGEVLRRFYRPMMQQARWVDPRPLAHERTSQADTAMKEDFDWAIGIVQASRLRRVCPLTEGNQQCRGLAGGALRFSPPYAVGTSRDGRIDSALVYVRYTPVRYGVESEIEFFMVRRAAEWQIASKRTMPGMLAAAPARREITDPQEAFDSLLAADRAFAEAGKTLDVSTTLTNMFVANVVWHAPGRIVHGRDSASRILESDSLNARSRITWSPLGGGIASDLDHGYTFGYVTVTRPDGTTQPGKYLTYWIRGGSGWRAAVYRRTMRPPGDVSLAMLPPLLPIRSLPRGDESTVQRYADELSRAEHAFSRDAAPLGLGTAFAKWGAPGAINMGGPNRTEFVLGPEAIGQLVGAGAVPGSEISWAPEQVIVSSTGDLGVTIGTIRIALPARGDQPAATRDVPFFTIWKRAWATDPWRYVAE